LKRIILLTFACLFMLGNQAYAHTGLESSNPENGSTVTEQLSEITLTFETEIEQTSSFELQDPNGETVSVNDLSVAGNTMTGNVAKPLENGDYQVLWKIIGVDGHPIEGEFPFTMNVPAAEEAEPTESETTDLDSTETKEPAEPTKSVEEETAASETADETSGNTGLWVVLGLVVVIVGSVVWMMRRKK
jgi:methionine-rich copper-binding protein CopC